MQHNDATPDTEAHELPAPFSNGPYSFCADYSVRSRNGRTIASVSDYPGAPANGSLLAAAWELFMMLHEYTSTDQCTDHPEGETCRFCISMNVLRRALNKPDEMVPLLTWFAKYKEQQQLKNDYREMYEAARTKISNTILHIEQRVLELKASQTRLKASCDFKEAAILGRAIAELSYVRTELEK